MPFGRSSSEQIVETKLQRGVWHNLNQGHAQAAVQSPDALVLHHPSGRIQHPSVHLWKRTSFTCPILQDTASAFPPKQLPSIRVHLLPPNKVCLDHHATRSPSHAQKAQ